MSWDAIGAVAELLGAIGVIASLVYLAFQIRQSTRMERARAFQEIFSGFNAHIHAMFSPQNIDLIVTGMADFRSLSGGDKLRFDHLMLGYFNELEATIFSKNAALLGTETLNNWAYSLRTRLLPYPGVRAWWEEAKPIFAPETRAFVDEQIVATDFESDHFAIKHARS